MQELFYKERLAIARLKKQLKGALFNPLYKLAIAKLVKTYKINLINLNLPLKSRDLLLKA